MNDRISGGISLPKAVDGFHTLAGKWELNTEEAAQVMKLSEREYKSLLMHSYEGEVADEAIIERVRMLISIHRALNLMSPSGAFLKFFKQPYPREPLNGLSIRQYLLIHSDDASLGRLYRWANSLVV
jgi:hypothetical protein|tara:strand:+ start:1328 stop:1708 length:381 start_codon:yes stop_codon:yes gene_type:complete